MERSKRKRTGRRLNFLTKLMNFLIYVAVTCFLISVSMIIITYGNVYPFLDPLNFVLIPFTLCFGFLFVDVLLYVPYLIFYVKKEGEVTRLKKERKILHLKMLHEAIRQKDFDKAIKIHDECLKGVTRRFATGFVLGSLVGSKNTKYFDKEGIESFFKNVV